MANVSLVISETITITYWVNFSARCTKFMANVFLSTPIAISYCVKFSARKVTKNWAKMSLYQDVFIEPIAIAQCINFSSRKVSKNGQK